MIESKKKAISNTLEIQKITPYILPILSFAIFLLIINKSLESTIVSLALFISQFLVLITGLIVSVFLLLQSLGKSNSLIQQICGGDTKHNCNHILSAKAANISSWLSLSDLGFLYFSGSLLLLLLSQNSHAVSILVLFNLLALPFTFWSVYYQWRIAKTWCRLCLIIQGLFWLQAIASFFILQDFPLFQDFNFIRISGLGLIFIFPLVLWLTVKPIYKSTQTIRPLKQELNKLKYNVDTFKNLLISQKQYVGTLPKTTIVLGNPDSNLEITMASNPFCSPCAKAHQFLEEWLKKEIDFRLNIIYTFTMDKNEKQNQFFSHLVKLKTENEQIVGAALQDWYKDDYGKLDKWKEKYPIKAEETDKLLLLEQVNWCKLNEVKGTPTFYINGYVLPENYRLKALKYVLMNME